MNANPSLITVIEPEPPGQQERWLHVAARVMVASGAFFFICFVYAFFYLRSVDSDGQWQPPHVSPSQGYGLAIAAAAVASAVALQAARRWPAAGDRPHLRLLALALGLGLASVALQIAEYLGLGFGPASGGYASVFVGWTVTQAIAILLTMGWVEVILVGAWRARRDDPAGDARLTAANLEAAALWWTFLAGVGVLAWILLYLV